MTCNKTRREVIPLDSHVEMAFREIPAGRFRMGSRGHWAREEPVHVVEITAPFWLGETPVTQEQFAVWAKAERVEHGNGFPGRPDHPAETMTWRQAMRFCAWLTRTADVEAIVGGGGLACLPTEAEWEYACRAGTDTEYHTGDGEAALAEAGWYVGNAGDGTRPVGRKQANGFCLFDMHGNVWEWCHAAWDGGAYRARLDAVFDPGAAERLQDWSRGFDALERDDRSRVRRGGSWDDDAGDCRSASRFRRRPGDRYWDSGFRVCLVRGPAAVGRGARNGEDAARRPGDGGRGTSPESDGARAATGGVDLSVARLPRAGERGEQQ